MEPYFDLGTYTRGTSTASTSAQTWFDRGLVWSYAFHHEEAIRCFERAVEHDRGFALARWGIAYAIGPNYNKQWEAFDPVDLAASLEKACDEVAAARAWRIAPRRSSGRSSRRSGAATRSTTRRPTSSRGTLTTPRRCVRCTRAHPDDLDVAALFADALMNLTPWALWDRYTGLPSEGAATLEAKEVLERALDRPGGRSHPGLVHLYVHLMEMSPFPEQALPVADELRSLVPDAGHLVHMPTHIDVLCGDYKSTLECEPARDRGQREVRRARGPGRVLRALPRARPPLRDLRGDVPRPVAGRAGVAADLEASLPEELLRIEQPPMADYLEAFVPMRLHVLIRFGLWEDILALPLPGRPRALLHDDGDDALRAGHRVRGDRADAGGRGGARRVPRRRRARTRLALPVQQHVPGHPRRRRRDARRRARVPARQFDAAFEHLRRAIALDDALPYDEPWGWMQPTRHAYGALLLEQGRVEEAETVYAEDLGYDPPIPRSSWHPGNVWSLHGYHECLVRLGEARAGADRQAAARCRPRPRRRPDQVVMLLPHDEPSGGRRPEKPIARIPEEAGARGACDAPAAHEDRHRPEPPTAPFPRK